MHEFGSIMVAEIIRREPASREQKFLRRPSARLLL
jgi:hypothetical protein